MELFTVYAPEAPWEPSETIEIFRQTIRQLANLAHTTSTKQPHFYDYYRILELLAEVKIGVLLVDLFKIQDDADDDNDDNIEDTDTATKGRRRRQKRHTKNGGGDNNDDDDEIMSRQQRGKTTKQKKTRISEEALQVLCELFRTLLQSVRTDHPSEISDFCQKTLVSCVEEFYESAIVPVPILDEILVCLGQGPKVLVLQQQQQQQQQPPPPSTPIANKSSRNRKRGANQQQKSPATTTPVMGSIPQYVQQVNPSYLVASAVIRRSVDRLSTPIASLLNGLVNSDPRSTGQSTISNNYHRLEDDVVVPDEKKGGDDGDNDNARILAALEIVKNLGKPQRQQQDTHHTSNVWSIICELVRVAPAILTTIIGNLTSHVDTTDVAQRILVVQTLGKLFVGGNSSSNDSGNGGGSGSSKGMSSSSSSNNREGTDLQLARQYNPSYRKWLQRSGDRRVEIRQIMLQHLLAIASKWMGSTHGGGPNNPSPSLMSELAHEAQSALLERLEKDPSADFRIEVIQGLCNLLNSNTGGVGTKLSDGPVISRHVLDLNLMRALGVRVTSKHRGERKTALTGLVQVYHRQYLRHHLSTILDEGDDCPIETVLDVLHECCPVGVSQNYTTSRKRSRKNRSTPTRRGRQGGQSRRRMDDDDDHSEEEDSDEEGFGGQDDDEEGAYYQWIPAKLFESASYTDTADSEMHSRVVTLMDDVLLGSELPHSNNKLHLTSTARAVGMAIVVHTIHSQYPLASHWMSELLQARAKLQSALKAYLDARGETRAQVSGKRCE